MEYPIQMKRGLSKLSFAFFAVLLLGASSAAAGEDASGPAIQGNPWTIDSRTLPAPAAASDALREAIANTPQPDIAGHIQATTLTTPEEWAPLISAANAGNAQTAEALAARWPVTITEDEIAGVTVRTVTPAAIDRANENRLFVHLHGGAYVVGAGRAGLTEAIVIAHRVKIPVVSIDYRMPPEHPFSSRGGRRVAEPSHRPVGFHVKIGEDRGELHLPVIDLAADEDTAEEGEGGGHGHGD